MSQGCGSTLPRSRRSFSSSWPASSRPDNPVLTDLADLRGPRYEVTFMIRFAAFAGLLAIMSPNVAADELWSLYVYEQAVAECGLRLTEEEEEKLDAAQLRAQVAMNLSRREAGQLYRQAREVVRAHAKRLARTC